VWAVIWAAALFLIATVMLLDRWYSATNHASFYAPGLAIGGVIALLGIAIVGLGMAGRRVGGITACAIIAMVVGLPAMATVYAAWNVHVGPNIGTAQWRPTGTALRDTYDVGIGAGELDLRNIAVGDKPQEVNVDIGIGRGKLILPRSVPIQVTAMVDVGDILIELPEGWTMDSGNGAARSMGWDTAVGGIDQEITAWSPEVEDGAEPLLRVKVNLSIGHLEIEQGEPS
jgi:hypothetical protein